MYDKACELQLKRIVRILKIIAELKVQELDSPKSFGSGETYLERIDDI